MREAELGPRQPVLRLCLGPVLLNERTFPRVAGLCNALLGAPCTLCIGVPAADSLHHTFHPGKYCLFLWFS